MMPALCAQRILLFQGEVLVRVPATGVTPWVMLGQSDEMPVAACGSSSRAVCVRQLLCVRMKSIASVEPAPRARLTGAHRKASGKRWVSGGLSRRFVRFRARLMQTSTRQQIPPPIWHQCFLPKLAAFGKSKRPGLWPGLPRFSVDQAEGLVVWAWPLGSPSVRASFVALPSSSSAPTGSTLAPMCQR